MILHLNPSTIDHFVSFAPEGREEEVHQGLTDLNQKIPVSESVLNLLIQDTLGSQEAQEAFDDAIKRIEILQVLALRRSVLESFDTCLSWKMSNRELIETLGNPGFEIESWLSQQSIKDIQNGIQELQKKALEAKKAQELQTRKDALLEDFLQGGMNILQTITDPEKPGSWIFICHKKTDWTFVDIAFSWELTEGQKILQVAEISESGYLSNPIQVWNDMQIFRRDDSQWMYLVTKNWKELMFGGLTNYDGTYQRVIPAIPDHERSESARKTGACLWGHLYIYIGGEEKEILPLCHLTNISFCQNEQGEHFAILERPIKYNLIHFVSCKTGEIVAEIPADEFLHASTWEVKFQPVKKRFWRGNKPNPKNFQLRNPQ